MSGLSTYLPNSINGESVRNPDQAALDLSKLATGYNQARAKAAHLKEALRRLDDGEFDFAKDVAKRLKSEASTEYLSMGGIFGNRDGRKYPKTGFLSMFYNTTGDKFVYHVGEFGQLKRTFIRIAKYDLAETKAPTVYEMELARAEGYIRKAMQQAHTEAEAAIEVALKQLKEAAAAFSAAA